MSKICVIGAGYVGLTTSVGLAELGHFVTCLEIDAAKVEILNGGKSTIFEHDLENLLQKNLATDHLLFTTEIKVAVESAEFIYVCVQTPQEANGSANMDSVNMAITITKAFAKSDAIWVTKSTVPVGTARRISSNLLDGNERVVSNPEFLREGTALHDFFNPDRILIGSANQEVGSAVESIYTGLKAPVVHTNWETSELLKYAANSFLATKLSFINEMAILCKQVGGDIESLRLALGLDSRIGSSFLQNGPGWGGSCFPKDVSALNHTVNSLGLQLPIIQGILPSNAVAKSSVVDQVKSLAPKPTRIAIWGLTFKAGTDDLRDSPSLEICERLQALGYELFAYDPTVSKQLEFLPNINICSSMETSLVDVDGLIVLTEWPEFAIVNPKTLLGAYSLKWVYDTRNILNRTLWESEKYIFS